MKTAEQVTTNGRAVFYTVLWPSFRKAALNCGWNIALHGSMASDMDLMAMPWTEDCKTEKEFVKALSDCIDGTVWKDSHFVEHTDKPHNRVVYLLAICSDFYIDLSLVKPKDVWTEKDREIERLNGCINDLVDHIKELDPNYD